jgi:Flp pilus assembly protein TadD
MDDIEILEQQAIDSAINLQWETAIDLNKQILKIDKENVDACLRLGFAYLQIKDIQEAQKYYNKSLKLRPKNQVALENLERLAVMEMKDHPSHKKGKSEGTGISSLLRKITFSLWG